jgi:sec-independent protein translocase protein TatA
MALLLASTARCSTPAGCSSRAGAPAARGRAGFAGDARALLGARAPCAPRRVAAARQRGSAPRRSVTTMGLFGLGLPELVVIGGVVAVLFGPSKLPELGKSLGKTVKSFQGAAKARGRRSAALARSGVRAGGATGCMHARARCACRASRACVLAQHRTLRATARGAACAPAACVRHCAAIGQVVCHCRAHPTHARSARGACAARQARRPGAAALARTPACTPHAAASRVAVRARCPSDALVLAAYIHARLRRRRPTHTHTPCARRSLSRS